MRKSEFPGKRALSARERRWQSVLWPARLRRACRLGLGVGLLGLSTLALAAPGGPIGTMRKGSYVCELPGDAMGAIGQPVPQENFTILASSIYATATGRGSYLLTGSTLQMTDGPKRGEKFHRVSENFLRKLNADGTNAELRCIREVLNNH